MKALNTSPPVFIGFKLQENKFLPSHDDPTVHPQQGDFRARPRAWDEILCRWGMRGRLWIDNLHPQGGDNTKYGYNAQRDYIRINRNPHLYIAVNMWTLDIQIKWCYTLSFWRDYIESRIKNKINKYILRERVQRLRDPKASCPIVLDLFIGIKHLRMCKTR